MGSRERAAPVAGAMALALAVAVVSACGYAGDPTLRDGRRLITGRLTPPDTREFSRTAVALQLVAVRVDASQDPPILAAYPGAAFNPSSEGGRPVRFSLSVPLEASVFLALQLPSSDGSGLGVMVARMSFAKNAAQDPTDLLSGRLPSSTAPLADLELGTLEIITRPPPTDVGAVTPSPFAYKIVILGDGASQNPLATNDTDGDGVPDLDDPDDDGDLIPDEVDPDANGDAVRDLDQSYASLLADDANGDLVPDALQGGAAP